MRRGEIAQRAGCHAETVRYYETVGLLPAPPRGRGRQRDYGPEHLRRLHFIVRARSLGFPVGEVRGLLDLVDGRDVTCAEVRARTSAHLAGIRERIADLRRLERRLGRIVAACDGGATPDCAIIEALFDAGDAGPA